MNQAAERPATDRGRAWLTRLAGLSESPRRVAAAFALGVFLSFSPFFGLQIAVGFGVALALRLNRVAVLAGLCANLPWVMVPWYALTTATGAAVLGVPLALDVSARIGELLNLPVYRAAFWERAVDIVQPFLWPFVLGSTLGAFVAGGVAYVVMARLLVRVQSSRRVP